MADRISVAVPEAGLRSGSGAAAGSAGTPGAGLADPAPGGAPDAFRGPAPQPAPGAGRSGGEAGSSAPPLPGAGWIAPGSRAWRHAATALFLAGFSSFALIYCVQPLLPAFALHYRLSPAAASLALSLTTGCLAVAIMLGAVFAPLIGRKTLMCASMVLGAVLNIAASFATDWSWLLAARAAEGLVLGGVPAVAMAWLADEVEPKHLGRIMGLYIAGTGLGAMMGRVGMGLIAELASWEWAMRAMGLLCLVSALGFILLLPAERNAPPRGGLSPAAHLRAWGGHLRNPALLRLYAIGFTLTGIFVTVFNYATFRLSAAPFGLSQMQLSLIFLAFAFGVVSSGVAGALADRLGRRRVLLSGYAVILAGLALTLSGALAAILAGIALVAMGFFIGHSVTSGWVGRLSGRARAHGASLYLWFYYLGASVIGSAGGWVWAEGGWPLVIGLCAGLGLAGAALTLRSRSEGGPG